MAARCLFYTLLGFAAFFSLASPLRNPDMVAYVAVAASWDTNNLQQARIITLDEVKQLDTAPKGKKVTERNFFNNLESFREILRLYTVKPFYVALVWAAHKTGLSSYAEATWIVSAASFFLLAILLAALRPPGMNEGLWLLALIIFALAGREAPWMLSRYSTPDALATLLGMAAVCFLTRWPSLMGFIICAFLMILTRTETVILAVLFCLAAFRAGEGTARLKKAEAVALPIFFILIYYLVNRAANAHGWQALSYLTFIDFPALLKNVDMAFTGADYLRALQTGVKRMVWQGQFQAMALLSIGAVLCAWRHPPERRIWFWLMGASWAYFALRYAAYPAWWEYRYYYLNYLVSLVAAAHLAMPSLQAAGQNIHTRTQQ